MSKVVESIGILIRNALGKIPPPTGRRRPSTKKIYETLKTLKTARSALTQAFGGPVKCRYAGCPPVIKAGKKPRKVLGTYGICRLARISHKVLRDVAIEDPLPAIERGEGGRRPGEGTRRR